MADLVKGDRKPEPDNHQEDAERVEKGHHGTEAITSAT